MIIYWGLLNSLNMIFHVSINVGTETQKHISMTTCL